MSKNQPKPDEIVAARKAAGLTQAQAADLIYRSARAWQQYEGGERQMPAASFELFLIKTKEQKMNYFFNYRNGEVTVSAYRSPDAIGSDIVDLAQALENERDEILTCIADQAALEDGAVWEGTEVSQSTLEQLHALLASD